jgi:hypothetical protein
MPVSIYPFPSGAKPSPDYRVEVDGQAIFTAAFAAGSYGSFGTDGAAEIVVKPARPVAKPPVVRPLRLGIRPEIRPDGSFVFAVTSPCQLLLEIPGAPDLMLFANPPEGMRPDPADPRVRYFAAGKVHDAGPIELTSGQTLYLEPGSVVKGHVHAHGAENVRVAGYGVLDGRHYPHKSLRLMVFDACRDVRVEGICTVGTPSWNLVLGACEDVQIDGVKLIGWVVTSDGIDVVGGRRVRIANSFLRNNDDCVVIKALDMRKEIAAPHRTQYDWGCDVEDVLVENCVLYNDKAGNAMEIGYETRTEKISDIAFRNIDVIGAHGYGGVFTIHNGDRARIENVLYEDIRVEHFFDKLVDFRIFESKYSRDTERGHIRGVRLRNIRCVRDIYNCVSLIGGFDANHHIEDVTFESFYVGENRVMDADALHLFDRHADGIRFE